MLSWFTCAWTSDMRTPSSRGQQQQQNYYSPSPPHCCTLSWGWPCWARLTTIAFDIIMHWKMSHQSSTPASFLKLTHSRFFNYSRFDFSCFFAHAHKTILLLSTYCEVMLNISLYGALCSTTRNYTEAQTTSRGNFLHHLSISAIIFW